MEESYNPLHVSKELINNCQGEVIEKILKNETKDWKCPICFENLDNVSLCFPFECYHLICYDCLVKNCEYIKKKNKDPIKILKCPICRGKININWKMSKILYKIKFNYQNKIINLYDINI